MPVTNIYKISGIPLCGNKKKMCSCNLFQVRQFYFMENAYTHTHTHRASKLAPTLTRTLTTVHAAGQQTN